jgi:nitrate reductase gamma subunit
MTLSSSTSKIVTILLLKHRPTHEQCRWKGLSADDFILVLCVIELFFGREKKMKFKANYYDDFVMMCV